MEFNIKVSLSPSVLEDATRNKQTVLQYVEANLQSLLSSDSMVTPLQGPLDISITDKGEPFIQINIDLHGIMRVIGGVTYQNKKEEEIKLILVDEGASFLLFQLKGNKALFYGGFNGTELKRFQNTLPNECFSYYNRDYRKLTMNEITVDQYVVYYYDTPEKVEDPRKKKA